MNADAYDLSRFVHAQAGIFENVLAELRSGHKRSHWMWFIFPQIDGLGRSSTAKYYSIKSREEARQYLSHPVLGPRLLQCTQMLLAIEGKSAGQIFGFPDDLKLRSSLTLFAAAAGPGSVFEQALDKYFGGKPDENTLHLLGDPAQ